MNLNLHSLTGLLVAIAIIGVIFWVADLLVLRKIGDPWRLIVIVIAGLALVIALLRFFGFY